MTSYLRKLTNEIGVLTIDQSEASVIPPSMLSLLLLGSFLELGGLHLPDHLLKHGVPCDTLDESIDQSEEGIESIDQSEASITCPPGASSCVPPP